MKILVVSSYLPYPLFSGGHIRLYNILKLLSKKHEITLICEKRSHQKKEDVEALQKICKKVIAVPRNTQWSLSTILKTGFSSYPFLLAGHANSALGEAINSELKNNYDIIHVETFYVMHNLPMNMSGLPPVVLVEHNIEYLVYERYANHANPLLRPFLSIDIAKIKKWEKYFWKKADRLVAVSEEEKKLMNRDDAVVVPNGVDTTKFKMRSSSAGEAGREKLKIDEKRILFIGDFKWIQNRDAVEFILKDIWPRIMSKWQIKNGILKLWIVGRSIPAEIKALSNDDSVLFDENAPVNTAEIFSRSFALLAPIRVGAGTSYKILESMASGLPVVTTSLGIEGVIGKDKEHALIGNTSEELAAEVLELLTNKKLYNMLSENGSDLVRKNYNWDAIVEKLEKVYSSVIR